MLVNLSSAYIRKRVIDTCAVIYSDAKNGSVLTLMKILSRFDVIAFIYEYDIYVHTYMD